MEVPGAVAGGNLQRVLNARGAYPKRLDSQAKILRRAGRRSQIEDIIDRAGIEAYADVPLLKLEARITRKMRQVRGVARAQVIDAYDGAALGQQSVSQMRTKKSGGAGDKYALRQGFVLPKRLTMNMRMSSV